MRFKHKSEVLKVRNLIVFILFLFQTNLFAQTLIQSPETEISGEDLFGSFHSMYNNKIAISATKALTPNGQTGAVYVFEKNGDEWELEQKIFPTDIDQGNFGFRVELIENTLFICISSNDAKGAVYIYKFNDSSWELDTKIVVSDLPEGESLGYRLAVLDENSFLVSTLNTVQVDDRSSAYYYERINGNWQVGQIINTSFDASRGYNVELNETNLFLSDKGYMNSNGVAGIVYVFEKQNGNWVEIQTLVPDTGVESGWAFGMNLDIFEDYLAVASYRTAGYFFKKNSSTGLYELESIVENPTMEEFNFCSSISLNENYMLVGSDDNKVFVFEKQGNNWVKISSLEPDNIDDVNFGFWDVDIYQNRLIIGGAHFDSDMEFGEDDGGVFIYELATVLSVDEFEEVTSKVYPSPAEDDIFIEVNSNGHIMKKEIFDMTGKLIKTINENDVRVDVSRLNTGLYFIKIHYGEGSYSVSRFSKN